MKEQLLKIAKGAALAAVGAVLTYLSEALAGTDFGAYTPAITAGFAVLANIVRKAVGL